MSSSIYESILELNHVPTALTIIIICLAIKYKKQLHEKHQSAHRRVEEKTPNHLQQLPTPPIMPIVGHMYLLRDYQDNPWDGLDEIRKEYGDAVSLKMGIHPSLLVSNYRIMKEILYDKSLIFSNRPNFPRHHIIFGGDRENSLALCSWSNKHETRRKFCKRGIMPSKVSTRHHLLENIVTKFVSSFTSTLQHRPKSDTANLFYQISKEDILFLTSDVFMKFLCNESFSHSDPGYQEFCYGCDFVFWDINQSYLVDFLPYLTSFGVGFSYFRTLKRVTSFLRNFIDGKIFEPRRAEHLSRKGQDYEGEDQDYLDTIIMEHLSGGTSMSLADYRVGFEDLLAGHAAVANILIRLLGHLALDEKLQDMIYEEAKLADIDNANHIPSLPIAEASLQEALRLASSPIVPHVAREETSLGDFFVPKGTMVLFNLYHLNLSENFWEKPKEFYPMRFIKTIETLDGTKEQILNMPKDFMPFSIGRRQCLGSRMVESISIVAVSSICRKYIIKANDEGLVKRLLTPKGSVALNPDTECFKLNLYPR